MRSLRYLLVFVVTCLLAAPVQGQYAFKKWSEGTIHFKSGKTLTGQLHLKQKQPRGIIPKRSQSTAVLNFRTKKGEAKKAYNPNQIDFFTVAYDTFRVVRGFTVGSGFRRESKVTFQGYEIGKQLYRNDRYTIYEHWGLFRRGQSSGGNTSYFGRVSPTTS